MVEGCDGVMVVEIVGLRLWSCVEGWYKGTGVYNVLGGVYVLNCAELIFLRNSSGQKC